MLVHWRRWPVVVVVVVIVMIARVALFVIRWSTAGRAKVATSSGSIAVAHGDLLNAPAKTCLIPSIFLRELSSTASAVNNARNDETGCTSNAYKTRTTASSRVVVESLMKEWLKKLRISEIGRSTSPRIARVTDG